MYTFWLGPGLPLPVTPGQLEIKTPSKNKTITLINEGEVSLLKKKGLKEISFEALLPQSKYPFANYNLGAYNATAFIAALKVLDASKVPFPFVVTRTTPKGKPLFFTSMWVTLEDYTLTEDANNGLDVMLSVTLKEYESYGTTTYKEIFIDAGRKAIEVTKARVSNKVVPGTYVVKKGDTLWSIAKKELGDESMEEWLWRWNKDLVECSQRGTKELQPGMVLKIQGPMYSVPTQSGGTGKLLLPDLADEQYKGGLSLSGNGGLKL